MVDYRKPITPQLHHSNAPCDMHVNPNKTFNCLALGMDGGGTKCDAVLVDESGSVLGWGRGGGSQALFVGERAAEESCIAAIRGALGEISPRSLWVVGAPESIIRSARISAEELHVSSTWELPMGLAMALETHGIVVLSGTGSFVAGMTEQGEYLKLDGLGPVLGDYGSGYQIGLAGLRAAMASSWGDERWTALKELVYQQLGVTSPQEVINLAYSGRFSRSQTASLARVVIQAAEDGDAIARRIILQAADDISGVLEDLIRALRFERRDFALVASGGIAQNCELYWSRVCERAHEIAPHLRPIRPRVRPCIGAALLALREMGIPWSRELLTRIEETQVPHINKIES